MQKLLKTALAGTIIFIAGCSAMNAPTQLALLGDAASNAAAERTIVIKPETRHINVTGGD